MNYRLNHGSGSGDVLVYVPAPTEVPPGNAYVYLYSKFGANAAANSGFEEWAVKASQISSLSGFVFVDTNGDGEFDSTEMGIEGVKITLRWVNALGQTVDTDVFTDSNGFYSFGGLAAGTYRIEESQPDGFSDGEDTVGTAGGNLENDAFSDIQLAWGANGYNYNFGEYNEIEHG
jgi:hypothetical protein